MTYVIPVSSLKQPRAERFAAELERAMRERGVGSRVLCEAVGCGRTAVQQWRQARILPRIAMARRLADALTWPRLARLAVELRAKPCDTCGTVFVDDSGSDNRRYCSPGCRRVSAKRVVGASTSKRAAVAERRALGLQRAVDEMCRQCEPDGVCATADCPLRPVSPLPLRDDSQGPVLPAVARPRNGYRAPGGDSARMRHVWASYSPEEAAARKARAADASRRARGLVPS